MKLTINKKDYAVHFGMAALAAFCREEGIPLTQMEQGFIDLDLLGTTNLVFAGLQQGARREKSILDLTVDDVLDAMDEDKDLLSKALEMFSESQGESKKKVKGT